MHCALQKYSKYLLHWGKMVTPSASHQFALFMPIMHSSSTLSNKAAGMCFLATGSYQLQVAILGQLFKHHFSWNLKYECRRIQFVFECYSKKNSLESQLHINTAMHLLLWKTWPVFRCLLRSQDLARNCSQGWPKYQVTLRPICHKWQRDKLVDGTSSDCTQELNRLL